MNTYRITLTVLVAAPDEDAAHERLQDLFEDPSSYAYEVRCVRTGEAQS